MAEAEALKERLNIEVLPAEALSDGETVGILEKGDAGKEPAHENRAGKPVVSG